VHSGTLTLGQEYPLGQKYPFTVQGLEVGELYNDPDGKVYNLKNLSDFEGFYMAAEAGAAIENSRPGFLTMRNAHRVVIQLSSKHNWSLAEGGILITIKK